MTTAQSQSEERPMPHLLHPLDIAPARPLYLTATVLQYFVSPAILVGAILLIWAVSDNPITPLVGPVIGLTLVGYAERRYRADAWAHVARKRQDHARQDPSPWAQSGVALAMLMLAAGVLAFVGRMQTTGAVAEAGFGLGLLAGLLLAELTVMAWDRHAGPGVRSTGMAPALRAFRSLAVVLIAVIGVGALAAAVEVQLWSAVLGASVVVAVSFSWYLLRLVPTTVRCLPKSLPLTCSGTGPE